MSARGVMLAAAGAGLCVAASLAGGGGQVPLAMGTIRPGGNPVSSGGWVTPYKADWHSLWVSGEGELSLWVVTGAASDPLASHGSPGGGTVTETGFPPAVVVIADGKVLFAGTGTGGLLLLLPTPVQEGAWVTVGVAAASGRGEYGLSVWCTP